jgi:nitrogen-specific signal transduction histidine kinase
METKCASPERSSQKAILTSKAIIEDEEIFLKTLNACPDVVLVLNEHRQIICGNDQLLHLVQLSCTTDVLGKRPGEAFNCIHSDEEEAGCGTSEFCRECGAVKSVLNAQKGQSDSNECHMTIRTDKGDSSLDLRVWTVPMNIKGEIYVVLTIRDIGDEKRREALEHTFFHDILNELGVVMGYSQNVRDGFLLEGENPGNKMNLYAQRLVETIYAQRDLLAAERDMFEPKKVKFDVEGFIKEITDNASNSTWARHRGIECDCNNSTVDIETDRIILSRIMINLIKNAVEATETNGTVLVQYRRHEKHIFSVHNDSVMPETARLQIFQRSFSTKGKGRGTGTYSIKLFAEKYLKGKVAFTSTTNEGTTFTVSLP